MTEAKPTDAPTTPNAVVLGVAALAMVLWRGSPIATKLAVNEVDPVTVGVLRTLLAKDCIRKVEVLEYPELGMEAVWRIEVEDFPAFIVVDDKGNDFFVGLIEKAERPEV